MLEELHRRRFPSSRQKKVTDFAVRSRQNSHRPKISTGHWPLPTTLTESGHRTSTSTTRAKHGAQASREAKRQRGQGAGHIWRARGEIGSHTEDEAEGAHERLVADDNGDRGDDGEAERPHRPQLELLPSQPHLRRSPSPQSTGSKKQQPTSFQTRTTAGRTSLLKIQVLGAGSGRGARGEI